MGWDEGAWGGVGGGGEVEWSGVESYEVEWGRMEWDEVEWSRVDGWNRWSGVE